MGNELNSTFDNFMIKAILNKLNVY